MGSGSKSAVSNQVPLTLLHSTTLYHTPTCSQHTYNSLQAFAFPPITHSTTQPKRIIGLFANWVEGSGWVLGQKALSQIKSHSLYCTLPHSTTLPHAPNTLTTHFKLSLSPQSLTPLPSQSALSIFSICLGSWLRV